MANDVNLRPPWQPGESGNPAGYSRGRRAIDDLLELIHEKNADRALSVKWLQLMLEGDFRYFKEYLERRDGQSGGAPEKIDLEFVASVMKEKRAKLERNGGLPGGSTPVLP